jgi:hypothetical protein
MFMAASPTAPAPASQMITATISGTLSGPLFLFADVQSGANVVSVSNVTRSADSGTVTVTPAVPNTLGGAGGTFSSTVRVRACMNDSTCATGALQGSPQTVNVTYVIAPPVAGPAPPGPPPPPPSADASRDVVAPRVAVTNVGGQFILRGVALGGTNSVVLRLNGSSTSIQASGVTQVSATEVRASYPALASGSYSVILNSGAVAFTGTLAVVPAADFNSTLLAFGETPDRISTLLYDAERNRLLVATGSPTAPSNNKLFMFRGPTLTRSVLSFANLRDLAFSADGLRLLAITDLEVLELDANLLTVTRRVPAPAISGGASLQRIAVANDGKAIISTGAQGVSPATPAFLYDTVTRTFAATPLAMLNSSGAEGPAGLVASGDGSHIYITQSTSTAQPILDYSASTGTLSRSSITFVQMPDQALAVDQSGLRVVPYRTATTPVRVLNGGFNQLGILDVNPVAIALNRQGTRAYVLDNGNMFRNYRLVSGVPNTTSFEEIPTSLITASPAAPGTSIKSGVTHDGATVFMAGVRGGVIVTSDLP